MVEVNIIVYMDETSCRHYLWRKKWKSSATQQMQQMAASSESTEGQNKK